MGSRLRREAHVSEEVGEVRKHIGIVLFILLPRLATAAPEALSFEDLSRRALTEAERLSLRAELARLESDVASSGRFLVGGPTLEAAAGPRHLDDGTTGLQAEVSVRLELLADGGSRAAADEAIRASGAGILGAAAAHERQRLRQAYLDAWLEQERSITLKNQIETFERLASSVRERVAAGAEARYELALVQGELLRLRSEADDARRASADAWARLRALADVPAMPVLLAPPGTPDLEVRGDALAQFESGAERKAIEARRSIDLSVVHFDQARRRSRWSLTGAVAKEAGESLATIGAGYRFPSPGESSARHRERDAAIADVEHASDVRTRQLATQFASTLARVESFGPIEDPAAFDEALAAVALRMELGKDSLSQALPVRRQILEGRFAALKRLHDAHTLRAELDALIAGVTP